MSGVTASQRARRHQKNLAAFNAAWRKAEAAGFKVDANEEGMILRLAGEQGLKYQLFPTTGTWSQVGIPKPKHQPGGLAALLFAYRAEISKAAALDAARVDLTLFSDASYCRRTGAAGWGAWMKRAGMKTAVTHGGELDELFIGSTEAETRGIANALVVAKARGLIEKRSVVMIQCDNIVSLQGILFVVERSKDRPAERGLPTKRPRRSSPVIQKSAALVAIAALAADLDLVLITRHVRGHQEGPSRQWVNRFCDTLAKEHMGRRRARIPQEEKTDAA